MRKQPLLISLVSFIVGILLYDRFPVDSLYIYNALALSLITLGFAIFQFKKFRSFAVVVFFCVLGAFTHFLNFKKPQIPTFDGKQNMVFQLRKKLNSSEKYRRYEVEILKVVNSDSAPFNAVVSVPKADEQLDFTKYYQTETYINRVEPPNNNFQFNYAKYLSRKNIFHQAFINGELITVPKKTLTVSEKIKQQRLNALQNIDHSSLQPRNKEFLKGIILADRTEMDDETVSDFNKSGLVHLLAISGTHMVIIFWLLIWVLRKLIPLKFKNLSIILALVFIWFFAIFIDYGSSVLRSCIMITAYYVFVLLQRKSDLLHALALAGFMILIFDTNQIYDVGFQLSFLAVLGIYWLNQPILRYLPKPKNNFQNFLVNIPSVSLSAQLATLPLVIYYFHQYSLVSILANLIIIPFSEIIIISSLVMTVLLVFKIDFSLFNLIYDFMVNTLLSAIKWFANLDFAFFKNIPMTLLEASLLLLSFYFLRDVLLKKDFKSAVRFSYGMLIFFALRISLNFYHYQRDEVLATSYFRDIVLVSKHHGEAVFYIREKSKPDKIEKYIVESYLNSRRIKDFKIETVKPNVSAVKIGKKVYKLDD
ncbi:ComEC family competence protein [Chryseobacterium taklimakanense]|uniref:ComEC family competence protein n=1 Tax=Chryseobacterium taklimakanense TaxID=536441 RepID=A0A239XA26_9FLAO|nr:ComEC/Rec2 family competence protein [Chryseobacterium taklimakanense]SNV43555.1 ComEC family competence protein [Chryseobacterium taklimakanense]